MTAAFASLCAPFIGFMASGFKRSVNLKDFATTLPGHGGLTDRMDCISIMGFFCHFLLYQFILKDQTEAEEVFN